MQASELRELSDAELEERHSELKQELFNLRFQQVTGQLDNSARLKQARQDIARVLTVQRERELATPTKAGAGSQPAAAQEEGRP